MIAVSEVYVLLTNIHDILVNAASTLVDNMAHILAYLFNSASHLVDRAHYCLIIHLSWFHGEGVHINLLPT